MELLTEPEIAAELASVPAWTRDGASITTVTQRKDFRDSLLYVGAVAYLEGRYGAKVESRTVREERVQFPLPRELRVVAV